MLNYGSVNTSLLVGYPFSYGCAVALPEACQQSKLTSNGPPVEVPVLTRNRNAITLRLED